MKKTLAALSVLALSACGGGSSGPKFVNPDSVQFSYGAPVAPSTAELDAAAAGDAGAGSAATLGDAAADAPAQNLANLPDTMASAVFADPTGTGVQARALRARADLTRRAAAYGAGNLVAASSGFDDPLCVSVSLVQVKYDHCAYTDPDGTVIGVNGTFNRQVAAASVKVFWDASASISFSEPVQGGTLAMKVGDHLQGDVTVTLAGDDLMTIVGAAQSDASASVSAPGQSLSMAFTHSADLDLDYQPSRDAVVGGTLELKRLWSERPQGVSSGDLPNLGVKFDWTGYHAVSVSWGTLP
jgi:hypothetical protein